MNSSGIIASTFGFNQSEMSAYRYQSTRTKQPIYSIGDFYVACGKNKPTDIVGLDWVVHTDQFFADANKTTLWIAQAQYIKS